MSTAHSDDGNRNTLLLVEDNRADALLVMESLQEVRDRVALHRTEDGEQGVAFLRRLTPYTAVPRPDLVLLDLNLPGRNGFDVLAEVKADTDLRRIPVVVLSSSSSPDDIARAYDLQANSYVTKPQDPDEFIEVVHAIYDFWFATARLPSLAHGRSPTVGG